MTTTRKFKTNLNCGSCVAAVKPYLDREPSIAHWEVDTKAPDKILTVEGEAVTDETVKAAVARSGFQVLGEVLPTAAPPPEKPPEQTKPVTYLPLVLLVTFLLGVVGPMELRAGSFVWERAMQHFMGGFFLAFSFFKLLDLRGFADAYRMYDVVARRIPAYGFVYHFIELLLGAAYLSVFQPLATNLATVVVMSVSAVGVVQSLLSKRAIRCACLGTVFNLPMSTVTLVEDALMVVMAAAMNFLGPHGTHAVTSESPSSSSFEMGWIPSTTFIRRSMARGIWSSSTRFRSAALTDSTPTINRPARRRPRPSAGSRSARRDERRGVP